MKKLKNCWFTKLLIALIVMQLGIFQNSYAADVIGSPVDQIQNSKPAGEDVAPSEHEETSQNTSMDFMSGGPLGAASISSLSSDNIPAAMRTTVEKHQTAIAQSQTALNAAKAEKSDATGDLAVAQTDYDNASAASVTADKNAADALILNTNNTTDKNKKNTAFNTAQTELDAAELALTRKSKAVVAAEAAFQAEHKIVLALEGPETSARIAYEQTIAYNQTSPTAIAARAAVAKADQDVKNAEAELAAAPNAAIRKALEATLVTLRAILVSAKKLTAPFEKSETDTKAAWDLALGRLNAQKEKRAVKQNALAAAEQAE
jgi:hypothetical protein